MAKRPKASTHVKVFMLGAVLALGGLGAYTWWSQTRTTSDLPVITVYQSPTCGCCKKWVAHLQENGFEVRTENRNDMPLVKAEQGVPYQLTSCHTGVVEGYVIEGHVPAREVERLLREKPQVAGLSVPGMPVGSPGMEQGDRLDPYDVVAFTEEGRSAVFARYGD